jgi:hypothetical protein
MLRRDSVVLALLTVLAVSACDDETVLDAIPTKDAAADSPSEASKDASADASKESSAEATAPRDDGGAEAAVSDASDEQPE